MTAVLHVLYALGAAVWVAFGISYGMTRRWWSSEMGWNLILTTVGFAGVTLGFILDSDGIHLVGISALIAVGLHRHVMLARTPKDVRR